MKNYKLWFITKEFQDKPIEENVRMALKHYTGLGLKIISVEVNKGVSQLNKTFEVDGILVRKQGNILPNHILLEVENLENEQ